MFRRFAKQAFQQLRAAQVTPINWSQRAFFVAATATASAIAYNTVPAYAQQEDEDEFVLEEAFTMVETPEQLSAIMADNKTKSIYLFGGDVKQAQNVARFSSQLQQNFESSGYCINLETHGHLAYDKLVKQVQEGQTKEDYCKDNYFVVMNKFNSLHFTHKALLGSGDLDKGLQEQFVAFLVGPDQLQVKQQLLVKSTGDNDIHIVSYVPRCFTDQEAMDKQKKFRLLHQYQVETFLNLHFWIVEDTKMAKELGIDTSKTDGDIYVIRETQTAFNKSKPTTTIFDYPFSTELIAPHSLSAKDVKDRLYKLAYNAPVIIRSQQKYQSLLRLKSDKDICIIYADPKHKDHKRILSSVVEANARIRQKGSNVIFVITTSTDFIKHSVTLHEDKPQAILIKSFQDLYNVQKEYLPRLQKIEGMSIEDYYKTCMSSDQIFADKPGDSDTDKNRNQTNKLIFSEERFIAQKMFREDNLESLKNPETLLQFVDEAIRGERKLFHSSVPDKAEKFSTKIVGQDFEKRVFGQTQDTLLLVYHPLSQKNRGLKQKLEELAKTPQPFVVGRYNGVNESPVYKVPPKLPAIVFFKTMPDGSKVQVEYPRTRHLMLKTCTNEEFKAAMEEFVNGAK